MSASADGASAGTRVGELLSAAALRLAAAGKEAPRAQATALLGHTLSQTRAGILARLAEPVAPADREHFDDLVGRRVAGHPLQYLLGRASFLDFEVRVAPGVFIPRPETEQVVARAIESAPDSGWVVDLGTGSGAIAIALARALPTLSVLAIDRSRVALDSAAASARDAGVGERIRFVQGDLLTTIRAIRERLVGMVVSNPPYAAAGEVLQPEVVEHEPRTAWEAGPSGLEAYRRIVPQAAGLLAPGAHLVLELGYGQHAAVPGILARDGRWGTPRIEPDFQGIARVLSVARA